MSHRSRWFRARPATVEHNRNRGRRPRRPARPHFETLERRTLLSYSAALVGDAVTFTGDDAADVITFDLDGSGNLRHNRFTAGDSGFISDIDLDSSLPGVQSLPVGLVDGVTVNAGGGDDAINLGTAASPASGLNSAFTVNGQAGADTLDVNESSSTTAVDATLKPSTLSGIGGVVTYITLESVTILLGSGNDTIRIEGTISTPTIINGGAGQDEFAIEQGATLTGSIAGQGDRDSLNYDLHTSVVSVNLTTGVATGIGGGVSGIERVIGGSADDSLTGSAGDDWLDGGFGNDSLVGGPGADSLGGGMGIDSLSGGLGNDVLDGGPGGSDRLIESANANFSLADASLIGLDNDTLTSIEQASLTGGAGNNILDASGFTGSATLAGGAGNDLVVGGSGADSLDGGLGNDTVHGGMGNDTLAGGAGNDLLSGGAGINTADYSAAPKGIKLKLKSGKARGDGTDKLIAIQNAIGTAFNDTFKGDDFANYFVGGFGKDRMQGLGGDDTLDGGAEKDTLQGDLGNDVLLGGAGDDRLTGGDGRDLLVGGQGSDNMVGSADDDILVAGSTTYDANDAAIRAIMAEWTSVREYDNRVSNLQDGSGSETGVNGSFFLGIDTSDDDATSDKLTGSSGQDCFLARLIAPALDVITDPGNKEVAENIA